MARAGDESTCVFTFISSFFFFPLIYNSGLLALRIRARVVAPARRRKVHDRSMGKPRCGEGAGGTEGKEGNAKKGGFSA